MRTEEQIKPKEEKKDEQFLELDRILDQYTEEKGTLITVLHQAQNIFGYLPREVQIYVAEKMGVPLPEVYSVVSFYSLFSMKPRGEYTIEVCMGTACYVKGVEAVLEKIKEELQIEPGEISEDGKFTIETTRCMGACSLAPVIAIDGEIHSRVAPEEIKDILEKYRRRAGDYVGNRG